MQTQQEVRKNLQGELVARDTEINRLHAVLDEQKAQIRKLEQQHHGDPDHEHDLFCAGHRREPVPEFRLGVRDGQRVARGDHQR